ncbi:MAG: DUF4249 domain-containing protein [Parabacteroides sp.]
MKRINWIYISCLLLFNSCYRSFEWENPDFKSHIVLISSICADSTIHVSVGKSWSFGQSPTDTLAEARVSLFINGQPRDLDAARPQAGDTVRLEVEADGFTPVEATTILPKAIPISQFKRIEENSLNHFYLTFQDPANQSNYYGLQIVQQSDAYDSGWMFFDTRQEPLFSPLSSGLLDDLLDQSNIFRLPIYPFSDETIDGQTYTLHVSARKYGSSSEEHTYTARLYALSNDYYYYILSQGKSSMPDLFQYGLADYPLLHHNVQGGVGIVASYAFSTCPAVTP